MAEKQTTKKTKEEKPKKPEQKNVAPKKASLITKNPDKKTSRIIQILKTEYPFEGILLGVLGIFVLLLGVYIFEGRALTIQFTDWFIFATPIRIKVFAAIVILIGSAAAYMSLSPFVIPGIKEMRRVSWPNQKTMTNHTIRVFGFMIFLGLMFVLYDFVLRNVFTWITGE